MRGIYGTQVLTWHALRAVYNLDIRSKMAFGKNSTSSFENAQEFHIPTGRQEQQK
jgi:hypothetical protein